MGEAKNIYFTCLKCIPSVYSLVAVIMAVPPSYSDLGKAAKDLVNKGYNYGGIKCEVKTATASGVGFTTSGSSNLETGKVAGSLESKYALKDLGASLSQTWTTDNVLNSEISVEDKLLKGLKLTLETSFAPASGKTSGVIKSAFKQPHLATNVDGAAVLGYEGFVGGYQLAFDAASRKLTKSNFAFGYRAADFQVHTAVNDGSEFVGSLYQKLSGNLETGVSLSWTNGSNATSFALASKLAVDADTTLAAKINNGGQLGVSYAQNLRPGVKVTLSSLIDAKNFNAGGHKLGLGLEFSH